MLRLSIILACLLVTQPIRAAESPRYLCIGEKATGFRFDGFEWVIVKFNARRDKFMIREVVEGDAYFGQKDDYPYGAFEWGNPKSWGDQCTLDDQLMACDGPTFKTHFSLESGRFLRTYFYGYAQGGDNNLNTPTILIGTCSKI